MSAFSNDFLSQNAQVDQASVQPFPNSRKVYVQGSQPDIRVPMREISLHDTPTDMGGEKNPPVRGDRGCAMERLLANGEVTAAEVRERQTPSYRVGGSAVLGTFVAR